MNKLMSLVVSRWSLVIVIIIIAAFLRLYNITETPPGFYPDEAIYANNGVEAWETGNLKVFYPENNGREGLWPNIIGFFIVKFGHEPWVSRSVAAMFGILTALGVYFLAKELFRENPKSEIRNPKQYQNSNVINSKPFQISRSQKIALLSSFFLATSFWHILFSRIGFRAIMAPFFLTWGIYFLLASLNKLKSPVQLTGQRVMFFSVLGGIFYGLGFHSYIAYRATPLLILIILLLYWLRNKEKEIRKKILLVASGYTLMAIIIFAPLGLYFLKNTQDFFGRTTQISVFSSPAPLKNLAENVLKTAGMFNFSGDWNWRHNIAGKPLLFWPVGILFVIGIFLAIKTLIQNSKIKNKFGFWILFLWLIITALPVVISNEGLPHALRAILMAPAVFILAGIGGVWLIEKITHNLQLTTYNKKHKLLLVVGCLLLVMLIFEAYTSYFILWGKNPNTTAAFSQNYVLLGKELRELPKELSKYVVVEASGVDVRGMPMPTQTVMFLTDTFTPEKQKEKNLYYIFPNALGKIDQNKSYVVYLK